MTTPRGLTQPYTSFIGSACQGIHHAPSITNTQPTHKSHHKKQQPKHAGVNYTKHKRTEITQTTHPPPSTNQKGQQTKGGNSMRFNARVHYTVLTQHPTPTTQPPPNTKGFNSVLPAWVDIQGIMPQTPNNAPTYPNKRVSQSTIWSTIILVNHLVNNHSG